MELTFSSLASAISWLFVLLTYQQYRERGKTHQLLWTLGMASFALAVTADTVARAQGGWGESGLSHLVFFWGNARGDTAWTWDTDALKPSSLDTAFARGGGGADAGQFGDCAECTD